MTFIQHNVIQNNYYKQDIPVGIPLQQPIPSASPIKSNANTTYSQSPSSSSFAPIAQLTASMHSDTQKLLDKFSEISGSVLYRSFGQSNQGTQSFSRKATSAPVIFDFSDRSWRMFNSETHVHHHHHNGKEEINQKQNQHGMRIIVGLIGLVTAGVTAFFIGKALAQEEEMEEENLSLDELKARWSQNKVYYSSDYQSIVDHVMNRSDILRRRKETNHTHKCALLLLSFIAGAMAVGGSITGSHVVMVMATGMGMCIGVAALFKLGYACFSNRDTIDAKEIEKGLRQLRQKHVVVIG